MNGYIHIYILSMDNFHIHLLEIYHRINVRKCVRVYIIHINTMWKIIVVDMDNTKFKV